MERLKEIEEEDLSITNLKATIYRKKKVVVAVSGGFDPIHIGHLRHFKEAKALGDELIVFLQPDEWLLKKKGYVFMPYKERKEIIESIKYVDKVVKVIDKDMSVAKTLEKYKPKVFAKGGDRTAKNMPQAELDACIRNGITLVYNVGGKKIQSSSWLVNKVRRNERKEKMSSRANAK